MLTRLCAIVGCLILSTPTAGGEQPTPQVSLLSCALTAAERTSVPAMLAETNLTTKSLKLKALTGLLAAAGRFEPALELVEETEEPDRVIAPALAGIAIGALRAGNDALADRVVARLSAMEAWTAPAAMTEIAEALASAGRAGDAHALIQAIKDPGAKARALIGLAASLPAGSKQVELWLGEALEASRQIRPRTGHHVAVAGRREYLADYGERFKVLLDLTSAFADREMIEAARQAAAAIDAVTDGKKAIWKARALLAVAGTPAAVKQAPELTAEALATIESAFERTVGDTMNKVEILGEVARGLEDHGKTKQARQALALARSTAEKQKQVDEPSIRASIGVETLVLLAGAHLDLGLNEQALAILDEAQALVDAFAIPKKNPQLSWDSESSGRHTRVEALVMIGARREQAGQAAGAKVSDAQLIAEIAKISDPSWRDSSWMDVASAYLDVERPERALEILRAGKAQAADQVRAWNAIVESLLAADHLDDAARVAAEMDPSFAKIERVVEVADRIERAGRGGEAEEMFTELLRLAGTPPDGMPDVAPEVLAAGSDRMLVSVAQIAQARRSPFLTRPATTEQGRILASLFRCR